LHFSAGASRLATNYLRQAKGELGDDCISAVLYPYLGFIGLQITEQLDANAFGRISECLRCHTFSGHVLTYPCPAGLLQSGALNTLVFAPAFRKVRSCSVLVTGWKIIQGICSRSACLRPHRPCLLCFLKHSSPTSGGNHCA
jgi:hypothetical protein